MSFGAGRSPARIVVAVCAVVIIVVLAVILGSPAGVRCPAVVEAEETFTLASIAPGSFQWSLSEGRPPGGSGLVREQVLQLERGDLVEMRLTDGLTTGAPVTAGQVVAVVRSLRTVQRLEQLQAERAALVARRDLLETGGPPEAIRAAGHDVAVELAERDAGRAGLARTRALAEKGLISEADLEVAELADEVRRRRVEAARAEVDVARRPPQSEAVAAVTAQIGAVDAAIGELTHLLAGEEVICPIAGVADIGAGLAEVRVDRLSTVYLEIPVPAGRIARIAAGAEVLFTTPAVPAVSFRGGIAEVAAGSSMVQGTPVFWASAEIDNPDRLLRSGMTGVAYVAFADNGFGPLVAVRRWLEQRL